MERRDLQSRPAGWTLVFAGRAPGGQGGCVEQMETGGQGNLGRIGQGFHGYGADGCTGDGVADDGFLDEGRNGGWSGWSGCRSACSRSAWCRSGGSSSGRGRGRGRWGSGRPKRWRQSGSGPAGGVIVHGRHQVWNVGGGGFREFAGDGIFPGVGFPATLPGPEYFDSRNRQRGGRRRMPGCAVPGHPRRAPDGVHATWA